MQAPDAERDLLIDAARAAGEVAMRHFRNAPEVWEKDDDQGPVTEADLEVNALLEERLRGARP
ncbi:MAG: 3'(2'),5'-bisphosphate nucleotidase CysQ, partial [Pseudomonadota bacterium]